MADPFVSQTEAHDAHPTSQRRLVGRLVLEQGQVIAAKYLLERPAGFGGMAQLWVATNRSTGAEVCVKLLVPDSDSGVHDEEAVERFRREAYAAAKLSHRAIVRVFDLLELDDSGDAISPNDNRVPHAYAIVMELLRGETLGDMLAKRGNVPLEEALDHFLPVLSALGHAHRAGVIHRDLKPDNIFLAADPDGHVLPKVLDFGVSKLGNASAITVDGVLVGTPAFMSPEQAKGVRQIDARSDVFSAGILFYMMLSGRNPFEDAPTFASMVDAVLRREVHPLADVPSAIWAVIERAIAKDPTHRFEDATEMSIALRKAAGRRATTTESESRVRAQPPLSEHSLASGASIPLGATRAGIEPPLGEAVRSSDAARRRRSVVAGILGAAVALIAAAAAVAAFDSAKPSPTVAPSSPPQASQGELTAGSTLTPPVAKPADATTAPVPSEAIVSAPIESAAVPVRSAASRPTFGGVGHAAPAAPLPTRTPGKEPQKARDPGF